MASWMGQQQDKGIEAELRNEAYEALWVGRKVIGRSWFRLGLGMPDRELSELGSSPRPFR